VQSEGGDSALDDAEVVGAGFGPAKQPVLPSHGYGAQRAFQVVGVDRHVEVAEEYLKSHTTTTRVGQRLGKRIARQQALAPELLCHPLEELRRSDLIR